MSERQPVRVEREVTAKDVFARSNMPSRWERLTNVAPKTARDRKYLAFVAARYRGDKRLPHPDELETPDEIHTRRITLYVGLAAAGLGIGLTVVGQALHLLPLVVAGIALVLCALIGIVTVYVSTQPPVGQFYALKSRCDQAQSRLRADPMDSENTSTVNSMIRCDEGTLAYCAAKIASEIEQDSNWRSSRLDVLSIDLLDELAEVGASARQITEDREATTALESGRLRDDPDVRATIDEDKALMKEAVTLLAARVYTFADYRDEVQRLSMYARRDNAAISRAVRQVADQQAKDRLL